jgi:hypothetical protein
MHFAIVLGHFMILSVIHDIMSVILPQCSAILQNCSVIPKFQSFFKMTDAGSRGGSRLTARLGWLASARGHVGPSCTVGVSRDRGGQTGVCAPSLVGSVGLVSVHHQYIYTYTYIHIYIHIYTYI